jgi:hypothetical protein
LREGRLQRRSGEEIVKDDADGGSGWVGNGYEPTEVPRFTFTLDGETKSCRSAPEIWRLLMQGWRLVETYRFEEMMDVLTGRETAETAQPREGWFDIAGGEPRAASRADAHLVTPTSAAPPPQSAARLLGAAEAAKALGISRRWLRRHAARLPFTRRIGQRVLYDADGIRRWLGEQRGIAV